MTLKSKLNDDLKGAMRGGDSLRRNVIRYLNSQLHNQEIADQSELDDDGVLRVLTKQAQQRKESIRAFEEGGRADLVEKESAELEIIMEYLPQQLTEDEIRELVDQAVAEAGAQGPGNMGAVMGRLMPMVRGRADGREVSAIVSGVLKAMEAS
jgi:uncharacterized protein YqeY